jgi:hypothetical protein
MSRYAISQTTGLLLRFTRSLAAHVPGTHLSRVCKARLYALNTSPDFTFVLSAPADNEALSFGPH